MAASNLLEMMPRY